MAEGSIRITYQEKELIGTASFITFGEEDHEIHITVEDDYMLLVVQFVEDEGETIPRILASYPDSSTVKLTFYNLSDLTVTNAGLPKLLGTIANRSIWFLYSVVELKGSESKHLTCSFYLDAAEGGSDGGS